MLNLLSRLFVPISRKEKFVTVETIRKANDQLRLRNPTNLDSLWPANVPKPTRSELKSAGSRAMQAHFAREAAEGGPWWQRDAVLQKQLKSLRGEPHLSLVKTPGTPTNS